MVGARLKHINIMTETCIKTDAQIMVVGYKENAESGREREKIKLRKIKKSSEKKQEKFGEGNRMYSMIIVWHYHSIIDFLANLSAF